MRVRGEADKEYVMSEYDSASRLYDTMMAKMDDRSQAQLEVAT